MERQPTLGRLEARVLPAEGAVYLAERRRDYLRERLRALSDNGPAVEAEYAKIVAEEGHLLDAIKAGVPLKSIRDEADLLSARRAELDQQRARLGLLQTVQDEAVGARLVSARLGRLRDVLKVGDLSAVRSALADVIIRIEIGGDGTALMHLCDGPLEPLPPGLGDTAGSAHDGGGDPEAASTSRLTSGSRDVPRAGPFGHRPGSRLCVVGATGFEPGRAPASGEAARGRERARATGWGRRSGTWRGRRPWRRSLGGCAPYGALHPPGRRVRAYPGGRWFESINGPRIEREPPVAERLS